MFALFFNLYLAMFRGYWTALTYGQIHSCVKEPLNAVGQLITSIFNNVDTPMATLGDIMLSDNATYGVANYMSIISFVLALITSIGIVVMAVKGVKKAFGIFFMGIRNI